MFNLGANYSQLNFFTFLSPLQQYNYIFESMISSKPKTKRIGKYHFRLIGPSQLFYKGEQIVSFTPQPKKYPHSHPGKTTSTTKSYLPSTPTANTTTPPFTFPLASHNLINKCVRNMKNV